MTTKTTTNYVKAKVPLPLKLLVTANFLCDIITTLGVIVSGGLFLGTFALYSGLIRYDNWNIALRFVSAYIIIAPTIAYLLRYTKRFKDFTIGSSYVRWSGSLILMLAMTKDTYQHIVNRFDSYELTLLFLCGLFLYFFFTYIKFLIKKGLDTICTGAKSGTLDDITEDNIVQKYTEVIRPNYQKAVYIYKKVTRKNPINGKTEVALFYGIPIKQLFGKRQFALPIFRPIITLTPKPSEDENKGVNDNAK